MSKHSDFARWYAAIQELDGIPNYDHRVTAQTLYENSRRFMRTLPLGDVTRVLDVGMGYGYHCAWFAHKGKEVSGISNQPIEDAPYISLESSPFMTYRMDMHDLKFKAKHFDLVWSHHSLEHSYSPMAALREWYRVLRPGGWLAVTVPPHKPETVSGHFNVGWSLGHLIYLLGVCGYNIRDGKYVIEGYNVRALVNRPMTDYYTKGRSWMSEIMMHLPPCVKTTPAPKSLGRFSMRAEVAEREEN